MKNEFNTWAVMRENLSSGVSNKVKFKPACSATGTSLKMEILRVASLDIILSNQRIIKALIKAGLPLYYSLTPEDRLTRIEAHI